MMKPATAFVHTSPPAIRGLSDTSGVPVIKIGQPEARRDAETGFEAARVTLDPARRP